jgi:hypothetical protein
MAATGNHFFPSKDGQVLLDEAWDALAGGVERPAWEVGPAGLPSRFRVGELAVACVGAALLAAAALVEHRDGGWPALGLDPGQVGAAIVSERHFRIGGRPAGPGFAPLSRFWRAGDGWVRTHANYPWHRAALLEVLGVNDDPAEVETAVQGLPASVVEDRVVAAGGVAAAVRSAEEWAAHPQGQVVGREPLIGHRWVAGAAARTPAAGGLPAAGVRVLDLTRVIAGPVCTRFLGALGADVLRIDPPHKPDMVAGAAADTLLGKRSAALDLTTPAGGAVLHDLLDHADVVVVGYRPGSLARFGLAADELAQRHPGLVIVQLSAWGHGGPWAERRGFDSVVQAPTGIAVGESAGDGQPGALPCQLLDHGTGYLASAAVLDGLRRQRLEGGTQVRTLSLARTAGWLVASGAPDLPAAADPAPDAEPWMVDVGADPPIRAVAPPGSIDGRPLRWPGPPANYLSDPVRWMR